MVSQRATDPTQEWGEGSYPKSEHIKLGHCQIPSATFHVQRRFAFEKWPRDEDPAAQHLDDEHSAKPAGAEFLHLWTVRIPRRSITGKLVWGRVWRCRDGRHWLYKCFGAAAVSSVITVRDQIGLSGRSVTGFLRRRCPPLVVPNRVGVCDFVVATTG